MKKYRASQRPGRLAAVACAVILVAACAGKNPTELVGSAKEYLAKNDYNAAVIQLKSALQEAPDNGEARLLLGTAMFQQRDFASAAKELRRALELGQSPDEVLPLLARALVEQGEHEALVKDFGDRRLKTAQAEAAFAVLIGRAHLHLGQSKQAEAAYRTALKAQDEYPPGRLGLAMVAAKSGDRGEAMKIADSVLAVAPKLAEAYLLKAELLAADGDHAGSRKALEKAVDVDASNLPARKALAQALIADRAFEQAAAQIDAARKLAPADLSPVFLTGLLEFDKGEFQKARDSAAQVLKYVPANGPALVLAGASDLRLKQFASAEAHVRRAVAQSPGDIGARRLLVEVYLQNGQPTRALEVLQPLLASTAIKDPRVAMLAGETLLVNGDTKQANQYFSSAAGSDDFKTAAQTRLGQLALARGEVDEGVKRLEAVAERDAGSVQADLALIAAHLQRNEFDKAMAAARALEKKQPNNPLSQMMLGTVSLQRKDAAAARKYFEKALQLQPTYMPAVSGLANLDLQENKPAEARSRFEAVIAKEPQNEQAHLGLAEVQARTGSKPADVAATLQRAVAANPQAVNPRLALVNHYLSERNIKEALRVAREANAAIPNEPRVLRALAATQEADGNVNEAIETLNKMAGLQPQSPQALLQLAALHTRKQEHDLAVAALRRAQRVAPEDRDVRLNLMAALARSGRFDDALKEAKAIQSKEPKFSGGYAAEGELYVAQKKWPEAERATREALKIDPRDGGLAAQLHFVLLHSGRAADADAFARKWLADNAKDARLRLYLANRALAAKNTKTAFGLLQEVVALEPNNAIALNNLAFAAGELGDARAVGYAERAVKISPNNPAMLDTLGVLLVNKGDVTKGFEYLDRARALAPNSPALRLSYAKALTKAGRKDEARKELETLKNLSETFPGKDEIDGLLKAL
jgi:putative PEP-CTERM system TPR-repeat lipoprotein